ncbi:MAG TPA: oligosaccharide flippase family protein [Stellaceae bacterium]|jgi:O-antigen/teichoic acid export membrane protein|nr:oligosaccharide flippase family protein [Stellaceae bacterium]
MASDSSMTVAAPLSDARRFGRNSAFGSLAGLLTALSGVLASIIVAHVLGVATTGVVAFAMWVSMVSAAIADLGIQASLARYLPELTAAGRGAAAEWLATMLWRWLAGSCAVALAGFAGWTLWRWCSGALPTPDAVMWGLVGLACALQALTGFTFGYLRGAQRFDRLALLTVLYLACQFAGVAFGSVYFGAAGAVGGYCAGSAVPAALSFRHALPAGTACPELGARVRRYALYAWAGALSGTIVWSRAELFFLERSTDSAAIGLFTVAVTLANLASQGPMLLTAGLLPYFAENFGKGATRDLQKGYATATRVLAFLALPACFGTAAVLPVLLPLLYGGDFADAVPAATVLVLAAGVGATASVGSTLVMAMDRSDFVFASGLATALLAVIAGFTVIPAFGLMGAAWSRAAIQIAAVAMGVGFLFWRLRFQLPMYDLAKLLLAAAICGLAARATLTLMPRTVALPCAIGAGMASYAVAVRALRALHHRDADRLRTLCGVFPKRFQLLAWRAIELLSPQSAPTTAFAGAAPHQSASDAD